MRTHLLHGLRAVASAAFAIATAAAASPYVRGAIARAVEKHPAVAIYVPIVTLAVSALEKWYRGRKSSAPK